MLSQICTYSADDLSRIASTSCGTSTWGQTFSYDPFGNIKKTVPGGYSGTPYAAAYSTVTNQVSSGVTPAATYDANGNQLTSTPATLTWNALNQPVTVNTTTATYDALNRMVEKYVGGVYTQFVYRPSGGKLAVYRSTLAQGLIPLPGGSTAIYNASGLNYIRHKDWLGSSRLATTWAHAVYSKEAYAPFGETYNEAGTADRSFTGQDQNVATGSGGSGEYDFLFRKYDPSAGRWLSPDPSGWSAVSLHDPQSLNRYAYVDNSPTNFTDPKGLDKIPCPGDLPSVNDEGLLVVNGCDDGPHETPTYATLVVTPIPGPFMDPNNYPIQVIIPSVPMPLMQWYGGQTGKPKGPWTYGHWCGPGGSGQPVDTLDTACMIHDYCYFSAGNLSGLNNFLPSGNPAALQQCNQALCDRAEAVISSSTSGTQEESNAADVILFFSTIVDRSYQCTVH